MRETYVFHKIEGNISEAITCSKFVSMTYALIGGEGSHLQGVVTCNVCHGLAIPGDSVNHLQVEVTVSTIYRWR